MKQPTIKIIIGLIIKIVPLFFVLLEFIMDQIIATNVSPRVFKGEIFVIAWFSAK